MLSAWGSAVESVAGGFDGKSGAASDGSLNGGVGDRGVDVSLVDPAASAGF